MREISVYDIENIQIGQAEDIDAGTGVTVVLLGDGAPAGLDVRGSAPASRESQLLTPLANAEYIHAVVLAGGSAFGLNAAGGVQQFLEERGIGFDVGVTKVPLVCQAGLFDLKVGNPFVRPDAAMGYQACQNALNGRGNYRDGCFGAGTGATVGKILGMKRCMKSGIGSYAVRLGELKVGAIVAVNALGDIYDPDTGKQIAGMLDENLQTLCSSTELMYQNTETVENRFTVNTTIGIVMTNAAFDKTKLCKIAGMTHDGFARVIKPVHTGADGDSVFAVSTGHVSADLDVVGTLAADVMSRAIVNAVRHASAGYGYPSWRDLRGSGKQDE